MYLKPLYLTPELEFFSADSQYSLELELYQSSVSAGFPSPADDYVDVKLDLNKYLIKHPSATFYVRVKGNSMINANIHDGDLLIVDKSKIPQNNDIAICVIDGDFTVKRLKMQGDDIFLIPENPDYQPIKVVDGNNFQVWGVVSYIIHKT